MNQLEKYRLIQITSFMGEVLKIFDILLKLAKSPSLL